MWKNGNRKSSGEKAGWKFKTEQKNVLEGGKVGEKGRKCEANKCENGN